MSSARHHGRYNCAHMALFQIFLLRIVHLTLGEDSFHCIILFHPCLGPNKVTVGLGGLFFGWAWRPLFCVH
jgi:hypothetical protein